MAKKIVLQNIPMDDSFLDNELNFPEDNFDIPDQPDDRTPAKKILDATVEQTKSTVASQGFIGKFLREALPDTYGEVYDTTKEVVIGTKELYNSAVREIKPGINELSKTADKLLPATLKRTKGALARIKEWSNGEEQYRGTSDKEIQEKNLAIELGDVFKFQMEEAQKERAEDKAEDKVQESLSIIRHKQQYRSMASMDVNIAKLARYQEKVTAAYQRKSLELQYRSYYLGMESLKESRVGNETMKASLQGILKNTALPEFVKIKNSERFKEVARTKLMEKLTSTTGEFISKAFKNIMKMGEEGIQSLKNGIETGVQMSDMTSSMSDSSEMAGQKKSFGETAAELGTDVAINYAGQKAGKYVRQKISKYEPIAKMTEMLRSAQLNGPAFLTDFAKGGNFDDSTLKTVLRDFTGAAISGIGPNMSIETDNLNSGTEPGMFTKQTNKSITEIIPGFLARIFRELQILRTGDESISLTSYDYLSNKFTSAKVLAGKIKDKLINKSTEDWRDSKESEIFSELDPDNKLTPEQRKKLMDKLLKDSMSYKSLSRENLSNYEEFENTPELKASAQIIAELFEDYFTKGGELTDKSTSQYKKRSNDFTAKIKGITESFNNPAQEIQKIINLGLYDEVRGTGLFHEGNGGQSTELFNAIQNNPKIKKLINDGEFKKAVAALKVLGIVTTVDEIKPKDTSSYLSIDKIVDAYGSSRDNSYVEEPVITTGKSSNIFNQQTLPQQTMETQQQPIVEAVRNNPEIQQQIQAIDPKIIKDLMEEVKKINSSIAGVLSKSTDENTNIINAINSSEKYKPIQDIAFKIQQATESSDISLKAMLLKLDELTEQLHLNLTSTEEGARKGYRKDTVFSNLMGLAGKGLGLGKKLGGMALKAGGVAFRLSKGTAKIAGKVTGATARTAANIMIKKRDIFVEGEIEPRLTAAGFRAGIYKDSITGKILSSLQDLKGLKGNVIDNNGDIVLSLEEVSKTFVKTFDSALGSVFNLGRALTSMVGSGIAAGTRMSFGFIKGSVNLVKKTYKAFANLLDRPVDIYIKDKLDKPVLLAIIMRAGDYVSATTGKVISKPSEIDGPIKYNGEVVLTMENLKEGIVDQYNNKIVSPAMKILRFGLGVAGAGIRAVIKTGSIIGKGIMKGTGLGFDFMKGIAGSLKDALNFGMGGKKSNEVLVQIRDILDSRLPGGKRKLGDKDGDGDRDGGWQDLLQNKKENKDDDKERKDNTIKPDRKNTIDKMLDGLSTIKDKIAGLFGLGGDGDGGIDINLPEGEGRNGKKGDSKTAKGGKKPSLLRRAGGKLLDVGKSVGGFALNNAGTLVKGAAGAGALYSGYNAIGDVADGNYGSAALNGGLAVAGGALALGKLGALTSGIVGMGSGALGIAAATAGVVGSILASPVALGTAAVAALGYGGYKLYKALRNMKPFEKLRMAQYGFSKEDMSYVDKIKKFESLLISQVTYDEDGNATLKDKDIDIKAIQDIFDFKFDSKERDNLNKIKKWQNWYIARFKPVFMTHMTGLNKLDKKHTLDSIDDEKDIEIKRKYLEMVKFEEGPYSYSGSPFEDKKELTIQKTAVKFYINEIYKEFEEKKKDGKSAKELIAAGGISNLVNTKVTDANNQLIDTRDNLISKIKDLTIKDVITAIPGGGFVYSATTFIGNKIQKSLGYGVDALEAIRFKAYGLKDMDRSKVIALRNLEKEIDKGISYQSDSSAVWKGSIPEIIKELGGDFGVNLSDTDKSNIWIKWFSLRFLPVFTAYCGQLRNMTNKGERDKAEIGLNPQMSYDIGKVLIALSNVWQVSASPWSSYELNLDPKSAESNLKFLEDAAKDAKLREEKAQKKKVNEENKASGKAVENAQKKLSTNQKSNYTDRRSEQSVEDAKINSIMTSHYGPAWRETVTEKDKADSIEHIRNDILAKQSLTNQKSKAPDPQPAANNPPPKTTTESAPASPAQTVGEATATMKDPAQEVKETLPGVKKLKGKPFNGFGTEVDTYINEAAKKYGIPEDILRGFVKMEGGWTGAMSPTGAIGTGQFIQSTWNALAKTPEGKEIGMAPIDGSNFRKANDPRRDKRINTLATGLLAKQNAAMLEKAGLPVNGENLYMVHNVGPGVIQTIKTGQASSATLKAMGHNGLGTHSTDASGFVKKQKEIFSMHYASANAAPKNIDTKILDEKGQWDDYVDKSKLPKDIPKSQLTPPTANKESTPVPKTQTNPITTNKEQPPVQQTIPAVKPVQTALAATAVPVAAGMIKTSSSYGGSVNAAKGQSGEQDNMRGFSPSLSLQKTPDMLTLATKQMPQIQDTAKELREILNPVGATLKASFDIQSQMLDTLKVIANKITNTQPQTQPPQTEQRPEQSNASTPRRNTPSRGLPEMPVSMAKTRYSA